jgi:hypothetical protein
MTVTTELVGFIITVLGVVTAAWLRVEAIVRAAKADALAAAAAAKADALAASTTAGLCAEALAAHRLHVAETYVSKAGLREQTEQIMGAIRGVSETLSHLNERIDRVIDGQPVSRRRSSSA